jgi:hypothetical protein
MRAEGRQLLLELLQLLCVHGFHLCMPLMHVTPHAWPFFLSHLVHFAVHAHAAFWAVLGKDRDGVAENETPRE